MPLRFMMTAVSVSLLVGACAPPPIDLEGARSSLLEAVEGYHQAAAAGDRDRVLAYYGEDAVMMPPNEADVVGHAAVQGQVEGFTSLEDFQLTAESPKVVVSAGGEMGYSVAAVSLSWTQEGQTVSERLRDVHVWARDGDGSWKLVVDVWNSLPAIE